MDTSLLFKKTGGFIKGICHPRGFTKQLKEAGIGWVRIDCPYPFNSSSALTESYISYHKQCRAYNTDGIGVITISPFPSAFVEAGTDPSTPEGLREVERVCEFLAADFAGMKVCWQAANEMFLPHFREPLTEAQAVEFLAASIRGLKKGNPAAAVGHNSVDREMTFPLEAVEEKCGGTDYIGFDLYDGTWSKGGPASFEKRINALAERTGKPVILMEFGFSSMGEGSQNIETDALAWLSEKGFLSAEDALNRLDELLRFFPTDAQNRVLACAEEDRAACLFSCIPHVLKTWPAPAPIPHTEKGQATFYKEILPLLMKNPNLGGAVIYCMQDSDSCFFCGQDDCPLEIAWGLLHTDGSPKEAYYVVKDLWA